MKPVRLLITFRRAKQRACCSDQSKRREEENDRASEAQRYVSNPSGGHAKQP
jgi:hypothetical protein